MCERLDERPGDRGSMDSCESSGPASHAPSLIRPREEVLATAAAHHGALDYAELAEWGLAPDTVLDFSVNSNPYGPSPTVREALAGVPLDRYPDRECLRLRHALASEMGVPAESIVVGNGTAGLLWLLGLAFLRLHDSVLILGPTFGEYARISTLLGARVDTMKARAEQGFTLDPEDVSTQVGDRNPRLVFVCNPNNPTGTLLANATIHRWSSDHPETLFVVDEAYLSFVGDIDSALACGAGNLLVLRSMTKDYALAGLRLGYAAGPPQLIRALSSVRPPWSVNAFAQAAGLAALIDKAHLLRTLAALAVASSALRHGLERRGYHPHPSALHYFLLPVGSGSEWRRSLLPHGILVRDCASFGLPEYVRIASRRPEDNARLLAALDEIGIGEGLD